ncbi:MAG: DUF882 domain-containing protein [Alphaproteobacteria bacterium]
MGDDTGQDKGVSRRAMFRFGGGLLLAAGLLAVSPAEAARRMKQERSLAFEHLHTGEKLRRVYWAEGRYIPQALRDIHYLLRDYRTDEVRPINLGLLDLLYDIHRTVGSSKPFEIVSAYRSPRTNRMLANASDGVARRSFHVQGMAADVRLADRDLRKLRRVAMRLDRGGVGYYPASDFVHVDVGPQRSW